MKKIITIMFAVILSCSSIIVAYADETPTSSTHTDSNGNTTGGGGGSFDSEQIYYDEIKGGTQTIHIKGKDYTVTENDKGEYTFFDGVNSTTVGDSETLNQLQGALKKGGTIETYNTEASVFTSILGAFIPTASKWGGALWNALNAVGDTKIKGTVNTDKTSDNYGAVTYDSTAVKQIYDLLMKQYMESHGMYDWYPSQYHSDDVSIIYNFAFERVANVMWNFGGTSVSKETAYAYMRTLCQTMIKDGCTFISMDGGPNWSAEGKTGDTDKWYIYFVNRDNFDNAAFVDGGGYYGHNRYLHFYDYEGNPLESVIACVDLIDFFNNYDSSQDVNDYVFYTNKRHSYSSPINWSQDGASLFVYQSAEKMYKDLDGGATDYITSDFASGNIPSSITLSPDMLSQDWDKFTDELADAITDALKGADSSEKQDKIDETFQRYLKKINSNIEDLNADNNKLTKKSNKLLDDILDKVKDINKDTNKYLKGIQKDYLKDIKSYCKDMKKSMSDILKNVKTIKHIEELNLLITALSDSDRDKALSDIKTDSKQVQSVLHRKFPTCVFNDAKQIFDLLSATPVAPVVTMRVGFESVGVSDVLTMDFHIFDDYIGQFRQLQELIYIFVLFRATRKMFVDGGDL